MTTSRRLRAFTALASTWVLAPWAGPVAHAVPVALQNATATYSQTNPDLPGLWDPIKTIDGALSGGFTSWAIFQPGGIQAETIVWETQSDLSVAAAQGLTFLIYQQEYVTAGQHNLGRFRLSYTTDDRSLFADGLASGGDVTANWVQIDPGTATSSTGSALTPQGDGSLLASGTNCCHPVYTVTASFTAAGITGFRLEAMKDPSLPSGGPGRESSAGNFHLSEFVVTTVPEPASVLLMALGTVLLLGRLARSGAGRPG